MVSFAKGNIEQFVPSTKNGCYRKIPVVASTAVAVVVFIIYHWASHHRTTATITIIQVTQADDSENIMHDTHLELHSSIPEKSPPVDASIIISPSPTSSPSTATNELMKAFHASHGPFTNIELTIDERLFDTLQNGTDIVKFQSMNHSFCATWYHYQMFLGSHHKTGSILMVYHFFTILTRYYNDHCNQSDEYSSLYKTKRRRHIEQWYGTKGQLIRDFDAKFQDTIQRLQGEGDRNADKIGIIMQHIVRNPVDVVISRYNYHLTHPDKYYGDIPQGERVITHIREGLPCDKMMYTECCNSFDPRLSPDEYSIAEMLEYDLQKGIECEYKTYQMCYHADLYESFAELQRIALREKDNARYHIGNFRLEDFMGPSYTAMSELFLDKMGIFEELHREKVLLEMLKHDLTNSKSKGGRHSTQGTYNKTLQMDILLHDEERCLTLKMQGLQMNYEWKYPNKC